MDQDFENIDDLFQAAFAEETAEVPAFVKPAIDKRIARSKRKGFGFFTWIAFGLLGVLIATYLWTFRESPQSLENQVRHTEESISADSSKQSLSGNGSLPVAANPANDQALTGGGATGSGESPTGQQETGPDTGPQAYETTTDLQTNQGPGDPSDQRPGTITGSSTTNPSKTGAATADGSTTSGSTNASSSTGSTTTGSSTGGSVTAGMDTSTDSSTGTSGIGTTDPVTAPGGTGAINPETENNAPPKTTPEQERDSSRLAQKDSVAQRIEPRVDHTPDPLQKAENYNPWMVGMTGGMNLVKSTYTATTTEETLLYSEGTGDRPGTAFNLDVKYRLNNSLTFGSGLGISQLIENYSFFKSIYETDSTITMTFVYDSLDTTLVIDTLFNVDYDTTTTVLYNQAGNTRASYIHIPLSIGTQIIRNKFRLDLYLMARFNYLVSASGGYVSGDTFVAFTKSDAIFRRWYIDFAVGTTVHYNLFGGLYASGSVFYKPAPGPLYQGTSFNRSIRYTHIGVGLSWKF